MTDKELKKTIKHIANINGLTPDQEASLLRDVDAYIDEWFALLVNTKV